MLGSAAKHPLFPVPWRGFQTGFRCLHGFISTTRIRKDKMIKKQKRNSTTYIFPRFYEHYVGYIIIAYNNVDVHGVCIKFCSKR